MTTAQYIFSWDKNAPLNKAMTERWPEYAEELFLSCFETYMADIEQKFLHDDEYSDVIAACANPEELTYNPLIRVIGLLAITWRGETGWGKESELYVIQQEILKDWSEWLKQIPKDLEQNNPDILVHIVKCVAFHSTYRGEIALQKLQLLMETHYLEPVQERIQRGEYWDALQNEWREKREADAAARKARYAERSIIGKGRLYLLELWESEKTAWIGHEWPNKKQVVAFFKYSGLFLLAVCGVGLLTVILWKLFVLLGWNPYIPYSEEESIGGITTVAISVTSILAVANIYALIFLRKEYGDENDLNNRMGLPEASISKDIQPWWLGVLWSFIFAVISAVLDTLTSNYMYQEHTNNLFQIGLMCVYGVCAFFIFYLWAKGAKLAPFAYISSSAED
ncbi:MAG: hypothetical protein ACK502_09615 [Alphaproteobacteria bacterium]